MKDNIELYLQKGQNNSGTSPPTEKPVEVCSESLKSPLVCKCVCQSVKFRLPPFSIVTDVGSYL